MADTDYSKHTPFPFVSFERPLWRRANFRYGPKAGAYCHFSINPFKHNPMNFQGQNYGLTRGSDVQRNGMFLELYPEGGMACAEVFYNDDTHKFSLSLYENSLPMEAVTWLIDEALKRLPARHQDIDAGP